MIRRIPIGIEDFRTVREMGLEYVDKSELIQKILDRPGVQVVLLPRPRRFGKSLNLSMLRAWFEKRDEDLSHLFNDLAIWRAGEAYRAHFQRYPVIYLNFKGTKSPTEEGCFRAIQAKLVELYHEHRYVLDAGKLGEVRARQYRQVLDGSADPSMQERALVDLSACLHAHYGEKVVVLIDEYDEPIHAGHVNGYASAILDFMRTFLGEGLKGNPHLHRAVMTGILRVAKENIFSGLNHLGVYSLLRSEFNTCFGFTEAEVTGLLERNGRADKLEGVRGFYNGYVFGGAAIYNPWSVLSFLDSDDARLRPYWVATSSNELVQELLELYALRLQPVFEALLEGGSIERVLEENIALNELRQSEDALWGLLVFAGYLKAEEAPDDAQGRAVHKLSIPNREVREVYATTFRRWMRARVEGRGGALDVLTSALLEGDAERFEEQLQAFVTNVLSYHDPGTLYPERVYQGFVVGLLAVLEPGYQVRSNRESGKGRPDVIIRPMVAGKPGVVLELEVARAGRKTLEQALKEGLDQLEGKDYGAELRAGGAGEVHGFAVAFDGKEVRVKSASGG